MKNWLMKVARRIVAERGPDVVIGGHDNPYLKRWFVIPRNPVFNVYLHQFLRSDDDRALHDHPWLFNCSILMDGMYWEHTPGLIRLLTAGDWKFRWGAAAHRIELLNPLGHGPLSCWTIFITGPRIREWGFHCPKGWVHWRDFTDARDGGQVGRGCDQ